MTGWGEKVDSSSSSSPWHVFGYFLDHRGEDLSWLWSHAWLSVVPVVAGLVVAIPVAWGTLGHARLHGLVMTITSILYTIPSLALFVVIPPLLGLSSLDPLQVPIALTVYSAALLVRVVAVGLASVPEHVTLAATAIGYSRLRRLLVIELPVAAPVISAGLRVATVANVSMVAVAGTIGMANLGRLFQIGKDLSTPTAYYPPIVLGIVLCVLLAVVLDALIVIVTRLLTPWQRAAVSA
jgi:osmoprotectant transport system permease protein